MDHISFSQLNMLLRCGEQYYRRYVKGEKIPPSASLVRGSCGHKAEELNFIQKMETKADLPVEDVKEAFSEEWEKEKYNIAFTVEELGGESPKKAIGKWKDSGITLVEIFHAEQAPIADPIAVEEDFRIEFEGGYPALVGRIDRIDQGDIIAELKFLSKTPSKGDIETDVQLTNYQFAFEQKYGRSPRQLIKQCAISTKTPKTEMFAIGPRPAITIQRYLNRLEKVMEAIQKGWFLPAPLGSWACSERFCGYYKSCKYHP